MSWGGGSSSGPGVKLGQGQNPGPGPGGDESWRKNAVTNMMSPEQVKAAGVEASKRPPGESPGQILHQRSGPLFKVPTKALAGFAVVGLLGYTVFFSKKKAEVDAIDASRMKNSKK